MLGAGSLRRGGHGRRCAAEWPAYSDPALAAEDEKVLPVQINGKRRSEIRVPGRACPTKAMVEKLVLADEDVLRRLEGQQVRKVIVVKDRIVNIVAN